MYLCMRPVHISIDQMQVFVMTGNARIMINTDVNAKHCLTKVNLMMDYL